MKLTVRKPTCVGCPHDLHFSESIPKRQHGVMMHLGEHFCTGGKRARRFKRSDPKISVPGWCPKRKTPCELRLYGFRDENTEILHHTLCLGLENAITPAGYRYALKRELHMDLTPSEFSSRCEVEPYYDLLGFEVDLYEVLEIDDGLQPVFFYKTDQGFVIESSFDTKTARKNKREDSI